MEINVLLYLLDRLTKHMSDLKHSYELLTHTVLRLYQSMVKHLKIK